MPLRPRKRLPTALEMEFPSEMAFQSRWKWNCVHAMGFQPLEMEFPSEMAFQSRWKWNCVHAMGFQPRWKWNFRRKWPSNHVGNGIASAQWASNHVGSEIASAQYHFQRFSSYHFAKRIYYST